MEHHQIAIYLGAMASEDCSAGRPRLLAADSNTPSTRSWRTAVRDLPPDPGRRPAPLPARQPVLSAALTVNFAVVPLVVAAMFTFPPADQAVRIGVLLVLLCPCVDYVIVFSGLAGGDSSRLLAATPLLLVAQMLLLPGLLYLFMGPDLADIVEAGPSSKPSWSSS